MINDSKKKNLFFWFVLICKVLMMNSTNLDSFITRNHYLSLAENQNNQEAQFLLGFIYYSGEYVTKDTKKSIHYLSLHNKEFQVRTALSYYSDLQPVLNNELIY